jgi:outer membrane protein W
MILGALPSFGQDNELGIFSNGAKYRSTPAIVSIPGPPQSPGYGVLATFGSNTGYGISFNHYVMPIASVEFTAQRLSADSKLSLGGPGVFPINDIPLGTISLTCVDAALQWHPTRRGVLDPYLGAGIAWIEGNNLDKLHQPAIGPQSGRAKLDDKVTWLTEAGANVHLTRHVAVLLQVKYSRYRSRFGYENGDPVTQIRLDPLVGELGLRWRI